MIIMDIYLGCSFFLGGGGGFAHARQADLRVLKDI